jgi:hypothetical protein
MQDTGQLIAFLLLAAFAVERIDAAAKFLLPPEPVDPHEQRRRKVLLFALSAAIALAIVDYGGMRIIERLQPRNVPKLADYWLTWLVLVAGTDRMKELMQSIGLGAGAPKEKKDVPPIRIVVDDGVSVKSVA